MVLSQLLLLLLLLLKVKNKEVVVMHCGRDAVSDDSAMVEGKTAVRERGKEHEWSLSEKRERKKKPRRSEE